MNNTEKYNALRLEFTGIDRQLWNAVLPEIPQSALQDNSHYHSFMEVKDQDLTTPEEVTLYIDRSYALLSTLVANTATNDIIIDVLDKPENQGTVQNISKVTLQIVETMLNA